MTLSESFGCDECWPSAADTAWKAALKYKIKAELLDESHFMIKIRSCQKCDQQFVSVFTESIDWADGEDPQFSTVMPITSSEASTLLKAGQQLVEQVISLAYDRRSLCRDFPKGASPQCFWSKGIRIPPHD